MGLTRTQVSEILSGKAKGAKSQLPKAAEQERRLRFHSQPTLSALDSSGAFNVHMRKVGKLLPRDKKESYEVVFPWPVATVPFTGKIYTTIKKLWDGRNPVFKYEFTSPSEKDDWHEYRTQELKSMQRWRTEGFEVMRNSINSIMVVDLPLEQSGDRPEPYSYYLDVNSVVDILPATNGTDLQWIIFKQDELRMAVICDEFYRIYRIEETTRQAASEPEYEIPHGLGYCPARTFWTTPLSYRRPLIKKQALSEHVGDLDMLLFFTVSNEHLNLYARYPVYWAFGADCNYENETQDSHCSNGIMHKNDGRVLERDGKAVPCPVCERKRLDGAGSLIEIDPPNRVNDKADLREPVGFLSIPREALEYNNEDLERRRLQILTSVTGFQGMPINNQAVNEKQVLAIFESLEAALKEPQSNFEQAIQWEHETICRLRYNSFQSASVNLGTEHYILTPDQLMTLYKMAREGSWSTNILDMLEDRYYETEYRNNPEQLQRQKMLVDLDPFRHRTVDEVTSMYETGTIPYGEYLVKVNMSTFVARFERENAPLTMFGIQLEYSGRIAAIKAEMLRYAHEYKEDDNDDAGQDAALRSKMELYTIGVRGGSITPQTQDEAAFRTELGLQPMSEEATKAWEEDQGVRRPVTLKSKTQLDAEATPPASATI